MEQNEAQGRLSEMKICREKYWEELSDSEKVERMRGEVRRLMRSVDCLMRSSNNMKAHKHLDGDIVIPLGYAGGEPEKSSRGENYF